MVTMQLLHSGYGLILCGFRQCSSKAFNVMIYKCKCIGSAENGMKFTHKKHLLNREIWYIPIEMFLLNVS